MPEFPIREAAMNYLDGTQEPWPDNVKLFQPYEVEQILLPDNASCLAVQAFLKMCNLPFEVEMRWNAEFMSPSGRVPFIKCGAFVVPELEPIVQFVSNKGVSLSGRLSAEEKAEMRAYMSLVTNVLVNAELYISWIDEDTYSSVTKVRNSSVYPWPLGWIQTRSKRNSVAKRLKALHWHEKTLDNVLEDVEQCCNSLSQKLGEKDFFFGTSSPLDALVYGHTRALLAADGPKAALVIKPITSVLLRHTLRIANMTAMSLTPQEEYLVSQAFNICGRRQLSPERIAPGDRSARLKRSRMCIKNSRDNLPCERDVFGFKPFASKQIIIMTSKEGRIQCDQVPIPKYDMHALIDENRYHYIDTIIQEVLAKVSEIGDFESDADITDKSFEMVISPSPDSESKYDHCDDKVGDYLDTIEEIDLTDATVTLHDATFQDLMNTTTDNIDLKSFNMSNDFDTLHNMSESHSGMNGDGANIGLIDGNFGPSGGNFGPSGGNFGPSGGNFGPSGGKFRPSGGNFGPSGGYVGPSGGYVGPNGGLNKFDENIDRNDSNVTKESFDSTDNDLSSKLELSDANSSKAMVAKDSECLEKSVSSLSEDVLPSGSDMTLRLSASEEISVESLLKYLRKKNASYNPHQSYNDVVDVD